MENVITARPDLARHQRTDTNKRSVWDKLNDFADQQTDNKTLWFIISLVAQGVLFLPVPAALIFYFNAPLALLAISLGLYFANIIAGMGGAGIRVMLLFFLSSIVIHLLMVAIFIL